MSTPLVTIIIVTWNSMKYLPYCLESIFGQTFKDFSVIIIDNGSTDGSIEYIKKNYQSKNTEAGESDPPKRVSLIQNRKNLGFAHANNQGIQMSKSKYVLLCNADIILEKDFLKNSLEIIKKNSQIASIGGKLLKAKWDAEELPKPIKTDIIDSCGVKILKSHKVVELGADEKDNGQYNETKEVFGTSGALVLYRKSTLEQIKYKNEYFDKNFFSYKEDIDLSWRMQLADYKAIYTPNAVAHHFRGISKTDERKTRPKIINQLSYKNHLLTISKNQTAANLIVYSPFIIYYELKKFIFMLLFERSTLPALFVFLRQITQTMQKRKFIMSNKKVSSKKIRKWFKNSR